MSAEVSGGGQPPHGRYYAELVPPSPEEGLQATVQEPLDAGERKEGHLAGAPRRGAWADRRTVVAALSWCPHPRRRGFKQRFRNCSTRARGKSGTWSAWRA